MTAVAGSTIAAGLFAALAGGSVATAETATEANLEKAIATRAALGFESSQQHVKKLFSDADAEQSLGAVFTKAELQELGTRESLIEEALAVRGRLEQSEAAPQLGGVFLDHERGTVVIATKASGRRAAEDARRSFSQPARVVVESVEFSLPELEAARARVAASIDSLRTEGIAVRRVGIDLPRNRVSVGLENLSDPVAARISALVEDARMLELSEVASLGTTRYSDPPPFAGGEYIFRSSGVTSLALCTSAFIVEQNTGLVRPQFALTAGHCENPQQGATWIHGRAPQPTYPMGQVTRNAYSPGSNFDGMAISLSSNLGSNEMFDTNTTRKRVSGAQAVTDEMVGQMVCKSGATTSLSCGPLRSTNNTITYNQGGFITLNNQRFAEYVNDQGDSGGAVFRFLPIGSNSVNATSVQATGVNSGIVTFTDGHRESIYSHISFLGPTLGGLIVRTGA